MPTFSLEALQERMQDFGSDYWYLKAVANTDGDALSPADTFVAGPIRANTELNPGFSENTKTTEGGNEVTTSSKYKYELKITTDQTGMAEYFTFPAAAQGKIIMVVLEGHGEGRAIEGKHDYIGLLVKLKNKPTIAANGSLEYLFTILKATDAITITLDAATFPNFAADFTTPATLNITSGSYFGAVEVNAPA